MTDYTIYIFYMVIERNRKTEANLLEMIKFKP